MGTVKTLHIVGYKNSGKTTLISRWVRLLKNVGLTVAVLKHHGHSSPLSMPDEETDGMHYFNNGADLSIVAGAGSAQLLMNEEPDFSQLMQMASLTDPDVVLIEGFKKERGQKVVLLRDENDWDALRQLSNIQAVIGQTKMELNAKRFGRNAEIEIDDWFLQWIKEDDNEAI